MINKSEKNATAGKCNTTRGLLDTLIDFKFVLAKRRMVGEIRKIPDRSVMRVMHRFDPHPQLKFLTFQSEGRRLVLNSDPPIDI